MELAFHWPHGAAAVLTLSQYNFYIGKLGNREPGQASHGVTGDDTAAITNAARMMAASGEEITPGLLVKEAGIQ